mgnify:CR=1 FL=1
MAICRSGLSVKNSSVSIAMDVRPGPLSRARENITRYGLEDYIETRLSDGLAKLEPGEGDTGDRGNGWSSDGKDIKGWSEGPGGVSGTDPAASVGPSSFPAFSF